MHANMTCLSKKKGLFYHWLLDLFQHLKLPVFDGMKDALQRANEIHAKNLEKKQTEEAKKSALIGKKLVYKSKRKESSGFVNREFSILTALIMTTLMNYVSECDDISKVKGVAPATITTSKRARVSVVQQAIDIPVIVNVH